MREILLLWPLLATPGEAMIRALHTAATGMAAQEAAVSAISHNIANANTVGYKRQRAETESLLYETSVVPGPRGPVGVPDRVGRPGRRRLPGVLPGGAPGHQQTPST